MSDTFDHMGDAYEQHWNSGGDDGYSGFDYDPNYHHRSARFSEIEAETDKAILFNFKGIGSCWVPKKLCRSLNRDKQTVKIWDQFEFNPIQKENIADMFDEVISEPVVKKVEPFNPDNIDLEVYYTDGTRRDEMPF